MNPFSDRKMFFYSNGFQLEMIYSTAPGNKIVFVGDSLLRDLVIDDCDVVCVPGARAEDLPNIVSNFPLQNYSHFILMLGGNSLQSRPKQGRMRWQRTIPQIIFDILAASQYLKYYGNVFVLGVPPRTINDEVFFAIKQLNNALRLSATGVYKFVGVGSKLSSKFIVGDDYIHLSQFGRSQLRSIVVNKIFREYAAFFPHCVKLNDRMLTKKWSIFSSSLTVQVSVIIILKPVCSFFRLFLSHLYRIVCYNCQATLSEFNC